jgi:hypothetical protein
VIGGADPQPKLGLKSQYRAVAFRAIESILRTDPVLTTLPITWRSREGFPDDYPILAPDLFPMIALSPMPVASTLRDEMTTRITFKVAVEVFVQGTCVDDILNLWEAIEDAIQSDRPYIANPNNPGTMLTVQQYLCNIFNPATGYNRGVNRLIPEMPSFFSVDLKNPNNTPEWQSGLGTLTCFLSRPA